VRLRRWGLKADAAKQHVAGPLTEPRFGRRLNV
jgi:hypothetical protein